jgi:hypothetical protein
MEDTLSRLRQMGPAMADEVVRQQQDPTTVPLAFEERFGWVVEAAWIARANVSVKSYPHSIRRGRTAYSG